MFEVQPNRQHEKTIHLLEVLMLLRLLQNNCEAEDPFDFLLMSTK
jgi:hypothetical protein